MNEDKIKQDIRNLLIESLDEVHLTLKGKYVPYESNDCYLDLKRRIEDAEMQRNCCDRGTAARMHYNGLLSLLRNKIKKHPQFHIQANVNLNENVLNEATLFSTFVQPLTDVFQTAKMAALQSLSATWMMLRVLITFDPAEIERIIDAHDTHVKNLENKYSEVLKRTNASLSGPDATVAFMLFAPNLWSSLYAKDWSKGKIESMKNMLGPNQNKKKKSDGEDDQRTNSSSSVGGAVNSTVEKAYKNLRDIFENSNKDSDDLIFEKNLYEQNEKNLMIDLLNDDNFKTAIDEMRKDFSIGLKQSLSPIVGDFFKIQSLFDPKSDFGKSLQQCENLEDLKKVILSNPIFDEKLKFLDLKNLKTKLLKDIEDADKKSKIISNPSTKSGKSFMELLKAKLFQSKNKSDKLKPEDIQKIKNIKIDQQTADKTAQKSIVDEMKKGFFTASQEQLKSMKSETNDIVEKKFEFLKDPKAVEAIKESDQDLYELIKKYEAIFKQ